MATRAEVREVTGISFRRLNPSPIGAGSLWILRTEEDNQLKRYEPYDKLLINNLSSITIEARINSNPEKAKKIAGNSEYAFTYEDAIWGVEIENLHATDSIGAELIELTFLKKGADADRLAYKVMKKLWRILQ